MASSVNQSSSSQLQPGLLPQLRYNLRRKQPRIKVSPPPSRNFPPPSPQTPALTANGSYRKVPSNWCPARRLWTRNLYLSRNSLLKKMIHQRILYRIILPPKSKTVHDEFALEILGTPYDFWVTMPIQPQTRLQNSDPGEFQDVGLDEKEGISIAYAVGPVKTTAVTLKRFAVNGLEPDKDGIPFQWVRDTTGTDFLDSDTIMSLGIKHIVGIIECSICDGFLCIGCLVPDRFQKVCEKIDEMGLKISAEGGKSVRHYYLNCKCDKQSVYKPVMSSNKINWMFLFLVFGIGFCSTKMLVDYCVLRELPTYLGENDCLLFVFNDMCLQIFKRNVASCLYEVEKDEEDEPHEPCCIQTATSQLQSGLSPLSPQLRYSRSRKQPRIKVSPPSSRSFPPPPPQTQALIAHGSYCKVPSDWCPAKRVWSRDLYLSRNSLLKKMIHQRILYRRLEPVVHSDEKDKEEMESSGIRVLGIPIDYWVTMPIHPPTIPENSDPPGLQDVALNVVTGISIAYATGPVNATRYALNRLAGSGPEQVNNGLPFHWVRNITGTTFTDFETIMSKPHAIGRIIGFVECPNCKANMCIAYLLPTRVDIVKTQLGSIVEKMSKYGEKVACKFHFSCRCDGDANSSRPIISDVLNKINWVFLFLGFGLGYCTMDQLKYYCIQRKLAISDRKNKIIDTVFDDLCLQITKRRVVRA